MLKTAGPGCIAGDLVEIRRLGAKIHAAVQADETYRMPLFDRGVFGTPSLYLYHDGVSGE
jgi:hypothetical protein